MDYEIHSEIQRATCQREDHGLPEGRDTRDLLAESRRAEAISKQKRRQEAMTHAKTALVALTVSVLVCSGSSAIHLGANGGKALPWDQPMPHPLDAELNEKYGGKCFFMNLGPTGIRAKINPGAPKEFLVMYVFKKSPAAGKIQIGDRIVGAGEKMFVKAHGFHRRRAGSRGWQGPPFELAQAIEDSQGKEGKLDLFVIPKGGSDKTTVTLQIKPVGRFSSTYPWDCPRSEKLRQDLCDFLIKYGIKGRKHYQMQQLLALYAADDKRATALFKQHASRMARGRPNPAQGSMCTWGWGYSGIFIGEYYNAFKDKSVIPFVKALVQCYEKGMTYSNGGFSHRPFPAIQRRVAAGGPKGYGAMAGPGGLSLLAQSIFKQTGLPYSELAYNRTHMAYVKTVGLGNNPRASIAYGLRGWPSYPIRLLSKNSPCKSKEGIGYRCPTGMNNIGEFLVEQWIRKDGGWNMQLVDPKEHYPWMLTDEGLLVFEVSYNVPEGTQQRVVIRSDVPPEPTSPFDTKPGGGGHCAPMGMGAAAHFIGNQENSSWNYLGEHLGNGCALSPGMLFDGHADATMHAFFSVVGALRARKEYLRSYLDYVKTLIVLSETHDGQGLVEQPFGCQRNATCSIARNRTAYTHVILLLLSLPKRKILLTGADLGAPPPPIKSAKKKDKKSFSKTRTAAAAKVKTEHVWTYKGQPLRGKLLRATGTVLTLRDGPTGRERLLPRSYFSEEDQAYLTSKGH